MKQCDNGHFYDEARFASCPYCQANAGFGKTVAGNSSVGKTVAAVSGGSAWIYLYSYLVYIGKMK